MFPLRVEVLLLQQLKKSPHRLRGDAGIADEFRVIAHAYPIRSGALKVRFESARLRFRFANTCGGI